MLAGDYFDNSDPVIFANSDQWIGGSAIDLLASLSKPGLGIVLLGVPVYYLFARKSL
jgi:hypothetical protein